jgi:hypothetical protein
MLVHYKSPLIRPELWVTTVDPLFYHNIRGIVRELQDEPLMPHTYHMRYIAGGEDSPQVDNIRRQLVGDFSRVGLIRHRDQSFIFGYPECPENMAALMGHQVIDEFIIPFSKQKDQNMRRISK